MAAWAAAPLAGCVRSYSDTGQKVWANGRAAHAHAALKELWWAKGPVGYTGELEWKAKRTVTVHWRTRFGLPKKTTLEVADAGIDEPRADDLVALAFAPDASRLAAVAGRNVWIIDVATARKRPLTEGTEDIVSFGWLGSDAAGYATQVRADNEQTSSVARQRFDVTFWRCPAAPPAKPVAIRTIRNVRHAEPARRRGSPRRPHHTWCADGRVVDIDTGRALLTVPRAPRPARANGKGATSQ